VRDGSLADLGKLRRSVMKSWLGIICLTFLCFGKSGVAFEKKDPYENFRLSIFEQIIAGEIHIKGEKAKVAALGVMRKMKTGEEFLNKIKCEGAAAVDRGTLDTCLNKVYYKSPEKFKAFYKIDLGNTIKALKAEGFIAIL